MKVYKLHFNTQYSQFYICDRDSPLLTGSDKFWTNEAFADRLAVEDGVLGVGTGCYGPIKGELLLLSKENLEMDLKKYDHIVEAGLSVNSGVIQVMSCPDSHVTLEIKVDPGTYRFRVYSSNLESVVGDEGDDFYRIEIWKDPFLDRKVLKRYA